jgi:cobalamin biosynthesis protein CobT
MAPSTEQLAAGVLLALAGKRDVRVPKIADDAYWRGRVDARALRVRFSDPGIHAELLSLAGRNSGLFELLEQARVEAKVPAAWSGVRANLAALRSIRDPLPHWDGRAGWEHLAGLLDDQRAFGVEVLRLIGEVPAPAPRPTPKASATEVPTPAPSPTTHLDALREARETPRGTIVARPSTAPTGARAYHAFTEQFDTQADAVALCEPATRDALAEQLRRFRRDSTADIARWARRLQRHLQVRQTRFWQFDREEGLLDCARLARVIIDPTQPLTFKQERSAEFPATAVTILVDNSGSMRGPPISMAAACAEILGSVLERCGVQSEILGFTTSRWRGGKTRTQWIADGRPADPGRLTDLLHVVYKPATRPWRRCRQAIAVMLDDVLLKENVDGEALLWAHSRLLRRPEPRKVLMVISDGAPCDEATLAENDAGYLDRHLRAVIREIEDRSPVELLAIGIGHDVGAHYSHAFTVSRPENLGEAMVADLIACLGRDSTKRRLRREETGDGETSGDVAAARFRAGAGRPRQ